MFGCRGVTTRIACVNLEGRTRSGVVVVSIAQKCTQYCNQMFTTICLCNCCFFSFSRLLVFIVDLLCTHGRRVCTNAVSYPVKHTHTHTYLHQTFDVTCALVKCASLKCIHHRAFLLLCCFLSTSLFLTRKILPLFSHSSCVLFSPFSLSLSISYPILLTLSFSQTTNSNV